MAKASDLSNGKFIKYNGDLYVIIELIHRTRATCRRFTKAKMRNIKSGKLGENRFRPDEEVDIVRGRTRAAIPVPKTATPSCVWTPTRLNKLYVDANLFGDSEKFLKEGDGDRFV